MAANQIQPFAQGAGANVLTQAAYVADAQRPIGNQAGAARAQLVNKAMLQFGTICAGLAQFMSDNQVNDITDQLTLANISAYMSAAVQAANAAGLTANHSLAPTVGYQKFAGGVILQWGQGNLPASGAQTSSVSVAYPIAYPVSAVISLAFPIAANGGGNWPTISAGTILIGSTTFTGSLPTGYTFTGVQGFGWLSMGY